ncbi:MAG: archaeosortase A, partial [Halobacteriaceae archaeon]
MVFTDLLAWAVIVLFLSTVIVDRFHRKAARFLAGSVWALFGIFWGLLFPKFAFGMHSFIEGTLSLIAVPACIYVGWLHIQGRDSLFVITRSVAFMGLIYAPFMMIEPLRQWIVETVAYQVHFLIEILGYNPEFVVHQETGYKSKFIFHSESGTYATFIILACTGIGSMAVFGGVIAALDAPIGRKLRGLALALPIIYVLNLFRNAFIA